MAAFMYRKDDDGETISRIFEDDETIPAGWVDSPARVDEAKPKRARKPKVIRNDNSA